MPDVKWFIGDQEIFEDERREIKYDKKTGEATLKIRKPKREDELIYRVQATNKFGKAECRANLLVGQPEKQEALEAPEITKRLEALFVKKGTDVTLEVRFKGRPQPKVKWYRNNKEIIQTEDMLMEEKRTILRLKKVKKDHAGTYEVKVYNPAGEAKTSATLQVTDFKTPEEEKVSPPRFIEALRPQFVAEGEVVILEARVESNPTCSFQWYQRSVPIKVVPSEFVDAGHKIK